MSEIVISKCWRKARSTFEERTQYVENLHQKKVWRLWIISWRDRVGGFIKVVLFIEMFSRSLRCRSAERSMFWDYILSLVLSDVVGLFVTYSATHRKLICATHKNWFSSNIGSQFTYTCPSLHPSTSLLCMRTNNFHLTLFYGHIYLCFFSECILYKLEVFGLYVWSPLTLLHAHCRYTMPTDGQGDSRSRVTFIIFQLPCIVRRIQKYFQRLVHRKIGYQLYWNKPESLNYKYNEGCAWKPRSHQV